MFLVEDIIGQIATIDTLICQIDIINLLFIEDIVQAAYCVLAGINYQIVQIKIYSDFMIIFLDVVITDAYSPSYMPFPSSHRQIGKRLCRKTTIATDIDDFLAY